ncbi:hypothetical protein B0H19DRAFT_1061739 [Mycena capillaripes]|nr:hypothetical protein B0H19DRAFT_1061739 [Mycena capillaripes]
MSVQSLPGAGTSSSSRQTFSKSLASNSNWLAPSILTAKMATSAADCLPFPSVKEGIGNASEVLIRDLAMHRIRSVPKAGAKNPTSLMPSMRALPDQPAALSRLLSGGGAGRVAISPIRSAGCQPPLGQKTPVGLTVRQFRFGPKLARNSLALPTSSHRCEFYIGNVQKGFLGPNRARFSCQLGSAPAAALRALGLPCHRFGGRLVLSGLVPPSVFKTLFPNLHGQRHSETAPVGHAAVIFAFLGHLGLIDPVHRQR